MANYSFSSSSLPFLLCLLLLCCSFVSSDIAKDRAECQDSLMGLSTCLTYVQGKAKAPTPDCCDGLTQLEANSQKCLCLLIRDRDDPGLGIKFNATLAMNLSTVCHHPFNYSQCPMLLGLAPHSKEAQIFEQFMSGNQANAGATGDAATASKGDAKENDGGRSRYYVGGKRWLGVERFGGVWAAPLLLVATLLLGG